MGKKTMTWKTKGMNQDLSVSAFNPEFAYENRNLRLSTNEGNTLMSWVTEKGTKAIEILVEKKPWNALTHWPYGIETEHTTIDGVPIGTAVLGDKLILFTKLEKEESDPNPYLQDFIYLFQSGTWETTEQDLTGPITTQHEGLKGCILYVGNLGFDIGHPLETMVSYEAEHIQKVYWTDGINQPRIINIAMSDLSIEALTKYNSTELTSVVETFFDFVPSTDNHVSFRVYKKPATSGIFAPGVIQYCYTYVNKYRQQTNVIDVSPLEYVSPTDRGASPEEKVSLSFNIEIKDADTHFDYVRLYSIQRTSLNATPIVKILEDLPVAETITYRDTGTTGYTIDPMELLYVGGRDITALTMTDKDNVLFMGNIVQKNTLVNNIQDYFDAERQNKYSTGFVKFHSNKTYYLDHATGVYSSTNTLKDSLKKTSTFKGGDTYRFGFQLQKKTGEWTEPIFIEDKKNTLYPKTSAFSDTIKLITAEATFNLNSAAGFDASLYRSARPVIVYPTVSDRSVLCQGVLNPTVFNANDRLDGSPYAQASWYFRPYTSGRSNDPSSAPAATPSVALTGPVAISSLGSMDVPEPFADYCRDVWVIHGTPTQLSDITNTMKIRYTLTGNVSELNVLGIITDTNSAGKYFFLVTNYPPPLTRPDTGAVYATYNQFSNVVVDSTHQYSVYEGLVLESGMFIYRGVDGFPEIYEFKFYDPSDFTKGYDVTFTSVRDSDYATIKHENTGMALRFTHYAQVTTQEEMMSSASDYTAPGGIKRAEIQGSRSSYVFNDGEHEYGSVYGTASDADKSNTQFFVDQSIVTLNSPDIEFDTDVQACGTDGLRLRIVGAIPITSNASAHNISISSEMLQTGDTYSYEMDRNHWAVTPSILKEGIFGTGERDINIIHKNIDWCAGQRLVSEYLWNDARLLSRSGDDIQTSPDTFNYLIFPWHHSGPLNNDPRSNSEASSLLKTKCESNLLFSINSEYFDESFQGNANKVFTNVYSQIALTENDYTMNYRLKKQRDTKSNLIGATSDINYYANIDKILYNENGHKAIQDHLRDGETDVTKVTYAPVYMKYKSTSHAVLSLGSEDGITIPILPEAWGLGHFAKPSAGQVYYTFWESNNEVNFTQRNLSTEMDTLFKIGGEGSSIPLNFLWLAELYREGDDSTLFGGTSKEALRNNSWCIGGEAVPIITTNIGGRPSTIITLKWDIGDTFYQRYDCLKTYPFTPEDPNQLVEILSFMCETHVNIDGRYDRNRGQIDNTNMSPKNFNLLNPVYSQKDNFFISKKLDTDDLTELSYPNQVYYSRPKTSGAVVDQWTNITLASVLELDGDKGQITSLNRLNDNIIAFQETGISQILYNERVQIASTTGVPIELANSNKVQGKAYISNDIGCSNKWSLVTTPSGIYFIDSRDKGIYLFNGQLNNLSLTKGFNAWSKNNIPFGKSWDPVNFEDFRTHYDKQNQEVLFVNKDECLAYSERLGAFTSFYDYGDTPYFCNFENRGLWFKGLRYGTAGLEKATRIFEHQTGDYCKFFEDVKPYWMVLVGNPEPQMDKIFTNIEFRATVDGDGKMVGERYIPTLPFDTIETWNEYQHGLATLSIKNGHSGFIHSTSERNGTLKRKFRIWRCDIPRDNAPTTHDAEMGIYRQGAHPLDRMRNPWLYLKLKRHERDSHGGFNIFDRTEFHDIAMTYFD